MNPKYPDLDISTMDSSAIPVEYFSDPAIKNHEKKVKQKNWGGDHKKFLSEMELIYDSVKKEKKVVKMGRPTSYSLEIANSICEEMASGSSLRSICRREDMPALASVFRWIRDFKEFREQYEIAMEQRTFALGEEILDIADDSLKEVNNADPKASGAVANTMKLRVDTRKWIMSKMQPKKYGDAFDMTTKGDKLTSGNTIVFQDFSMPKEEN